MAILDHRPIAPVTRMFDAKLEEFCLLCNTALMGVGEKRQSGVNVWT